MLSSIPRTAAYAGNKRLSAVAFTIVSYSEFPTINAAHAIALIKRQQERGEQLLFRSRLNSADFETWSNTTIDILIRSFGIGSAWIRNFEHSSYYGDELNGLRARTKMLGDCVDILEATIQNVSDETVSMTKTEQVLPSSVVQGTRGYLEKIILQANGCYERQLFDPCSVMIRKFVEILIIEVYEAHGKSSEIKDAGGDFLTLRDLVANMLTQSHWNLGRETKKELPNVKSPGDRSAHNRRYLATKQDVDKVIPGLRVIADDLLHLANLK